MSTSVPFPFFQIFTPCGVALRTRPPGSFFASVSIMTYRAGHNDKSHASFTLAMSPSTQSKQPQPFSELEAKGCGKTQSPFHRSPPCPRSTRAGPVARAPLLREQRSGDGRDRDLLSVLLLEELGLLAKVVPCRPRHRAHLWKDDSLMSVDTNDNANWSRMSCTSLLTFSKSNSCNNHHKHLANERASWPHEVSN